MLSSSAFVKDGALHVRDDDGWPRDAGVVVHDGDKSWTDYSVSVTAGFAPGSLWDYFNLLTRTNGFRRASDGLAGDGYELEGVGSVGWPESEQNLVHLWRMHDGEQVELIRAPFDFKARSVKIVETLVGGHITEYVDDKLLIDVTDSDPLTFGGVGLHSIWESEAVFDNLTVTSATP